MVRTLVSICSIALICSNACTSDVHGLATQVQRTCGEQNTDETFFHGVLSHQDERREADARGVSKLLLALGEQSIACESDVDEVYRLAHMPEAGNALIIRAERIGRNYSLTLTPEARDGKASSKTTRQLSAAEWQSLTRAIRGYNFWSRPPYPSPTTISHDVIVVHGPAWLLEGRDTRWYHAVSRVSASKERAFDAPARTLFKLAGLEVPDIVKERS